MSEPTRPEARKASMGRLLLFALPIALFAAIGAVLALHILMPPEARNPGAAPLSQAPSFDLPSLHGAGRVTSDLLTNTDRPVVVNFWASWCVPCREEHPQLMRLAESGAVTLVGVAYKNAPQDAALFLAEHGNPFAQVGVDSDGFAAVNFGVRALPETFVISPSGKILYHHFGPISPEEYEEVILPAIAQAQAG